MRNIGYVIDLDGVLADAVRSLCHFIWHTFRTVVAPEDIETYNVMPSLLKRLEPTGISEEKLNKVINASCWQSPAFYADLDPYFKMWQGLHSLRSGRLLGALTGRPENCRIATAGWLNLRLPGFDGVVQPIVHAPARMKSAPLRQRFVLPHDGPVVFIEDDHRSAVSALEADDTGRLHCWVVSRPWNGYASQARAGLPIDWRHRLEVLTEQEIACRLTCE